LPQLILDITLDLFLLEPTHSIVLKVHVELIRSNSLKNIDDESGWLTGKGTKPLCIIEAIGMFTASE